MTDRFEDIAAWAEADCEEEPRNVSPDDVRWLVAEVRRLREARETYLALAAKWVDPEHRSSQA